MYSSDMYSSEISSILIPCNHPVVSVSPPVYLCTSPYPFLFPVYYPTRQQTVDRDRQTPATVFVIVSVHQWQSLIVVADCLVHVPWQIVPVGFLDGLMVMFLAKPFVKSI